MQAQTPRWLTAVTRSKCSIGSAAASEGGTWMPALLNAMSSRPYSARARSTIAATCASSATSQATLIAVPPSRAIRSASFAASSPSMSARTTEAPLSANMRAVASPMPLAAPVTRATWPLKSYIGFILHDPNPVKLLYPDNSLRSLQRRGRLLVPLDRLPAVDNHGVPDDEGRRVRAQPNDGRGDLLGLAHPPDRLLRDHPRPPLGGASAEAVHHRGLDDPGTHRVHAEVRRGIIERGRFREADHAELRRRIGGLSSDPFDARARRRVHDDAAALPQHERNFVPHAQEHVPEIDVHQPVPFVFRYLGERHDRLLDTGIVEGEVE